MSITAERKQEADQGTWPRQGDTGSPEVQVAILTEPHPDADRAFQDPREGQSFAPRPADDGQQAPFAARLSQARRRPALHRSDRQARPSQVNQGRPRAPFAYRGSPAIRRGGLGAFKCPQPLAGRLACTAEPAGIRRAGEGKKCLISKLSKSSWGGKTLKLETGRVARQADGAVLATLGETVVLCAVTAAKSVKPGRTSSR
jgi:hypothetical protein